MTNFLGSPTVAASDGILPDLSTLSPEMIGYICCCIAVLGFGTNYVPLKQINVGDGMFFQCCMAAGLLLVGTIFSAARGFAAFEAFAMLGGVLWATGNLATVAVIQALGLGPGVLVWGMSNMLTGWATGRFGLFGVAQESVANDQMNMQGVLMAMGSLMLFTQVDNEEEKKGEEKPLVAEEETWVTVLPKPQRKALGFTLAIMAGLLFGSNFNPPTILLQQGQAEAAAGLATTHSPSPFDYVFSHFCGIAAAAWGYFGIYYKTMSNPFVSRDIVLPAMASGVMWAIAQIAWFKANDALSLVVAFPIITTCPGVVAALWGIFLFGEVSSTRSKLILAGVFALQICAVIFIAMSKN